MRKYTFLNFSHGEQGRQEYGLKKRFRVIFMYYDIHLYTVYFKKGLFIKCNIKNSNYLIKNYIFKGKC